MSKSKLHKIYTYKGVNLIKVKTTQACKDCYFYRSVIQDGSISYCQMIEDASAEGKPFPRYTCTPRPVFGIMTDFKFIKA